MISDIGYYIIIQSNIISDISYYLMIQSNILEGRPEDVRDPSCAARVLRHSAHSMFLELIIGGIDVASCSLTVQYVILI